MQRLEQGFGVPLIAAGLGVLLACPSRAVAKGLVPGSPSIDPPAPPILAQTPGEAIAPTSSPPPTEADTDDLNLDPALIETSPVLQDWLEEVPDVLDEIRHDPAFRTRVRLGYTHAPDQDAPGGVAVGVEDLWLGRTGLTVSAGYQTAFDGPQEAYGADLRYYLLPLGSYVNVAPVLGYRHLRGEEDTTAGVNVGARLMLALSRTGAADLSLTQVWTAPGQDTEVGTTTLSLGYAIAPRWRISTDLQRQGSRRGEEARWGFGVEWLP